MLISSTKATILIGTLMTLSLPALKAGSVPGSISETSQVKPKPIHVTGCLQKGDKDNEFVITDKAGKKYEIESKSVDLAAHVGHTVTVNGTILGEEKGEGKGEGNAADEKHEKGEKEATAENDEKAEKEATAEKNEKGEMEEAHEYQGGHVQVASLTMVSPKCE